MIEELIKILAIVWDLIESIKISNIEENLPESVLEFLLFESISIKFGIVIGEIFGENNFTE